MYFMRLFFIINQVQSLFGKLYFSLVFQLRLENPGPQVECRKFVMGLSEILFSALWEMKYRL